jgi:precorrin-6y C5,15-methyltransferase (decarboxylating) CbiE subunit
MPKLYLVGVGPGANDLLTQRAKDCISSADIVLGWQAALDAIAGIPTKRPPIVQDEENVWRVAKEAGDQARREGLSLCILRTGDPCVSSAIETVLHPFSDFDIEVAPGISSVQVAAAKARVSLEDSLVVSFHKMGDREASFDLIKSAFGFGRHIVMLCDEDYPAEQITKRLSDLIPPSSRTFVCSNLTLPAEKIFDGDLTAVSNGSFPILSVIVVVNPSSSRS